MRPTEDRLALLQAAIEATRRWVLTGSLVRWGDAIISEFDIVIFLVVPTEVRLKRLLDRELERYGVDAVAPGGSRHEAMHAFLDWASRYDDGGLDVRSRALHEEWLGRLQCPVVRLEGDVRPLDLLAKIERRYADDP